MSAIQSNKSVSAKLLGLARRSWELTELGWDVHISFDPGDEEAQADALAFAKRGDRLSEVMKRRAEAEGVCLGEVYALACTF